MEIVKIHTQKLEDELQKLGMKIKHHEDNLKFLKNEMDKVDDSILDLRVNLGKYLSSPEAMTSNKVPLAESDQQTLKCLLEQDNTAAGIICQMKAHHGLQASKLPSTKDVLGVVATLGKVNDSNLSKLFSEYLGLESMLAIVCKTYEGVQALEKFGKEGNMDKGAGLHGLGLSIGRNLEGRFLVFCLENLRPYVGEFVPDDSQKRLGLLKPKLPTGETPPGFIGFAVNMIYVDPMHLSYLTASGHGLRETLFYNLFSRLQVYKTRSHMQQAMPYISNGAISLDGGIIKSSGLFYLGERNEVKVNFPVSSVSIGLPAEVAENEERIKRMTWKRERLVEDTQREEAVLKHVKNLFNIQKEEYRNYLRGTATM